jgi:hypothetical protein
MKCERMSLESEVPEVLIYSARGSHIHTKRGKGGECHRRQRILHA